IVFAQESVAADAISHIIMVGKREAQQVCRKSPKVKARVRPSTGLEAIKIKATVNAIVDAVPAKGAMDRSQGLPPLESSPLLDPLKEDTEPAHDVRSGG